MIDQANLPVGVKRTLSIDHDMAQEKQATFAVKDRAPIDTLPKGVRKTANEESGTEPALTICTTAEHLTPLPDPDSPSREESSPILVDLSVLGRDDITSPHRYALPAPLKGADTFLSYFFPENPVVPNWVPVS